MSRVRTGGRQGRLTDAGYIDMAHGFDFHGALIEAGRAGAEAAASRLGKRVRSAAGLDEDEQKSRDPDQDSGQRYRKDRGLYRRYKRFSMAAVQRAPIECVNYVLGAYKLPTVGTNIGTFPYKYLVSEFNPGTGGFFPIAQRSHTDTTTPWKSLTPMHCYDLNFCSPETTDHHLSYSVKSTTQNQDINSRQWIWSKENLWVSPTGIATQQDADPWAGSEHIQPRWVVTNPEGSFQNQPSEEPHLNRFYRKSIDIRMILYGCEKMATEFDVRVIQITDPQMCPDYPVNLVNQTAGINSFSELDTFKMRWQNLVRPWVINPSLRGVERVGTKTKPWFRTVLKKRVTMGEQTTSVESIPCREIALHLDINELNDTRWDDTNFVVKTGAAAYDAVPDGNVTDTKINSNHNAHEKVWFTKRYYLLVRALSPYDVTATNNQDGAGPGANNVWPDAGEINTNPTGLTRHAYIPSYDLIARTYFMHNLGVA